MPPAAQATEPDYRVYANKEPTDLQRRFPDWITDKTGYDPTGARNKDDAFRAGVRLATALRMEFQASPENRAATEARRTERAAAAQNPPAPAEAPVSAPRRGRPPKTTAPAANATVAPAATTTEAPAAPRGRRGPRKATASTAAF